MHTERNPIGAAAERRLRPPRHARTGPPTFREPCTGEIVTIVSSWNGIVESWGTISIQLEWYCGKLGYHSIQLEWLYGKSGWNLCDQQSAGFAIRAMPELGPLLFAMCGGNRYHSAVGPLLFVSPVQGRLFPKSPAGKFDLVLRKR